MPSFLAVEEKWGTLNNDGAVPTPVDIATNTVSAEELVRSYVYQVHKDAEYAARREKAASEAALVPEEKRLNAVLKEGRDRKPRQTPVTDWKQSAEIAIEAFRQGRLFVFVDQEQVTPGTPTMVLPAMATVRFVQILPLVGG